MNDANNLCAAEDRANILALVDNMEPLCGCVFSAEHHTTRDRGRTVAEQITGPDHALTLTEVADVLNFLHESHGRMPLDWRSYQSPHPVCGLSLILKACENALRGREVPQEVAS